MPMLARMLLVLPMLAFVAGCSTWSLFGGDKDEVLPDEPAEKLYNEGVYYLNEKHDPKAAAKKFEEVDRQHPYSEWARKSLLMSAYSYYDAKNYDETISSAKRYISLHPGTSDAAYAMYLVGASFFDQIPDVSRDQGRTEKAMAALEEVIRKFPDSEYATSARRKIEGARDQQVQGRGDTLSDHAACRGSSDAADRVLPDARHRARSSDRGSGARA